MPSFRAFLSACSNRSQHQDHEPSHRLLRLVERREDRRRLRLFGEAVKPRLFEWARTSSALNPVAPKAFYSGSRVAALPINYLRRFPENDSNTGIPNVRCESVGFGEGMNFFLTLQTLDPFTGPNCFQFVLKNRAGLFIFEPFLDTFGERLHPRSRFTMFPFHVSSVTKHATLPSCFPESPVEL